MKPISVARRYARALAEVVQEKDPRGFEKVASELDLLSDVLGDRPQLLRFFEDPSTRREDRKKVVATLAGKTRISVLTRQFVDVLIENRRLSILPVVAEAFEEIKDETLSILPVEATTAVPLSNDMKKRFRQSLEKMTGRSVRLDWQVDPDMLGGARTRIGSRVYDGSLRQQLAILKDRLADAQ